MERSVKEEGKGEAEMKAALALRCVIEWYGLLFFFSSFNNLNYVVLFLRESTICEWQ
jgi:hypothetical protein